MDKVNEFSAEYDAQIADLMEGKEDTFIDELLIEMVSEASFNSEGDEEEDDWWNNESTDEDEEDD